MISLKRAALAGEGFLRRSGRRGQKLINISLILWIANKKRHVCEKVRQFRSALGPVYLKRYLKILRCPNERGYSTVWRSLRCAANFQTHVGASYWRLSTNPVGTIQRTVLNLASRKAIKFHIYSNKQSVKRTIGTEAPSHKWKRKNVFWLDHLDCFTFLVCPKFSKTEALHSLEIGLKS